MAKRLDDANTHRRLALDAARQQNSRGLQASALFTLGEIIALADSAEIERVEAAFQEALTLARSSGMRPLIGHCHLGLAKLYRGAGRRRESQDHLVSATALYRAMDMASWLREAERAALW